MTSSFNIVFPFQKIDKEQRVVTGIATADNVDYEDDRISFEGSLNAFSNWIGNIREMHSPIAVGKLVDFRPVPVSHRGKVYNGIEVSVYISKGAEDTWQKILDGTLRGFSIGGRSMDAEMEYDEDLQRQVRVIKEYILGELSVVDNPCNPAGMFTMVKMMPDGTLEYEFDEDDDSDLFDKAVSDVDLTPTDAMAASARRGLEWRQEYGRGGTAVGVARARDIANKKTLSPSTVRRMKSFFARHEVDKKATGWNSGEDGFPSAGRVAWELWGGDSGKSWADSKDARLDQEEKMVKVADEQRVFYCDKDRYAVFGEEDAVCPVCMDNMAQIGFAEAFSSEVINKMISNFNKKGGEKSMDLHDNNVSDKVSDMSDLTDRQRESVLSKLSDLLFGNKDADVASVVPNVTVNIDGSIFSKGIMTEESDSEEDEVVVEAVTEQVDAETEVEAEVEAEVVEAEDDTVNKSVEVDEESASDTTGGEEMDLNEILEKFTSVLDEKLEKVKADITAEVDEKITKSVEEAQEATSETIEKLNDEVEKIADTGAMKKSVDAEEDTDVDDEEVVEKSVESFWGGRFVPTSVAKSLGYNS
jgi:hypothetical protein